MVALIAHDHKPFFMGSVVLKSIPAFISSVFDHCCFSSLLVQYGKSSYVCPHGPAKSPVLLNAAFVSFE